MTNRLWQEAQVVAEPGGRIGLEFRPVACSRCAAGQGCGAGVFARLFSRRPVRLPGPPGLAASPGTRVRVGLPAASLARIALRLYGLPLLAFVAAAAAAGSLAATPAMADFLADFLALAAGLIAGGAVLAWQGMRVRRLGLEPLVQFPETADGS